MDDTEKSKFSDFDKILFSCQLGNKKCNSSMFSWTWDPILFSCFRFNYNQSAKIQVTKITIYFNL